MPPRLNRRFITIEALPPNIKRLPDRTNWLISTIGVAHCVSHKTNHFRYAQA